jgi:hypothetical protein
MKTFLFQFLLLLTVFLRAEFFVLEGNVTYHNGLPFVAETEWVQENLPLINPKVHYGEYDDTHSATPFLKPFPEKTLYFHVRPLFYQEKLQLTEGYQFVFPGTCKSNIPHLNRDDEDPAFILG